MELIEVKEGLRAKVGKFASEIEPFYKQLNWTWGCIEPPNVDEIEEALEDLIDGLDKPTSRSTGGLEVFWEDTEGDKCYGIRFIYDDIRFY